MQNSLKIKPLIGWLVRVLGGLMILAAIGAERLGLDRSGGWGPARRFLLEVGLLLVLLSLLGALWRFMTRFSGEKNKKSASTLPSSGQTRVVPQTGVDGAQEPDVAELQLRKKWTTIVAAFAFLICALGLTWIISVGRWADWPATTAYFHLQADAFRVGQAHLAIEPDARLLALDDPYDYENRKNIPHLWDATLYDGKYYLYWGPAPALVTIILEWIPGVSVGDNLLVWLFCLGTLAWMLLITRGVFNRHFKRLSIGAFILAVLSMFFMNPLPWMAARPAVYEVAIQGAQFFFMGGLYWLLKSGGAVSASSRNLFLTGLFWALAVATRASLAIAVISLSCAVLFLMIRERKSQPGKAIVDRAMLAFMLPLILGAFSLAYYNFVRFGSLMELGHQFALSSWKMNSGYASFITSASNIGPNIYNYFLNPFRRLDHFPYLKPGWGIYAVPFLRMAASASYGTERVTGLVVTSPIILFAVIPLIVWVSEIWKNLDLKSVDRAPVSPFTDPGVARLYSLLLLSFASLILPLLVFHANSMRYMMDFAPSLMLLSWVSSWALLERLAQLKRLRSAVHILLFGLAMYGVIASFILAITGQSARFESLNPELFDQLSRWFAW